MEEMEAWRPPLKHLNNVLVLLIYGYLKLSQAALTMFLALKHILSLGDCKMRC